MIQQKFNVDCNIIGSSHAAGNKGYKQGAEGMYNS